MTNIEDQVMRCAADELRRITSLTEFGFEKGDYGQLKAEGCRVIFYSSCGEWEVDIFLPNGSAIGFDIAFGAVHGRTAKQIAELKARQGDF